MKKLLLGAAAVALTFAACKKDDNNSNNNTPASANTLKIGDDTYTYGSSQTAFQVSKNTIIVSAIKGDDGAGIVLNFPGGAAPTAGTYRVISEDSVGTMQAGQVAFVASKGASYYQSTGAGAIDLKVTLNNGKYTLNMPTAPARSTSGNNPATTVSLDVAQK